MGRGPARFLRIEFIAWLRAKLDDWERVSIASNKLVMTRAEWFIVLVRAIKLRVPSDLSDDIE